MIGAIIGDVVGSRFEFNNIKSKDFSLLTSESKFTDDTVLTVAIMDYLCNKTEEDNPADYLKKWALKYPFAGYGGRFASWMYTKNSRPYNSCGNGSAMRVSSVAYLSKTEEEVIENSDKVTCVTHNHPEGIKGARVTALMIYKALHGASKEELKKFAISNYPEIKKLDYQTLVMNYHHDEEICQKTVPQAIYCFLISNNFEDCLRTTISIGGDCDTTAAISCAIADAFYGAPIDIEEKVYRKLPNEMRQVVQSFKNKILAY